MLYRKARSIDKEFKKALVDEKRKEIRNNIRHGDPRSFFDAVKVANGDFGSSELPQKIKNGVAEAMEPTDKAQMFSNYFEL